MQGRLSVTASAVQEGGRRATTGIAIGDDLIGKPDSNPQDPGDGPGVVLPQNVELRLTLLSPSRRRAASKEFTLTDGLGGVGTLSATVRSSQAGKRWQARVTNIGRTDAMVGLSATFIAKGHLTSTTAIPLRVLNSAAQQAIDALG